MSRHDEGVRQEMAAEAAHDAWEDAEIRRMVQRVIDAREHVIPDVDDPGDPLVLSWGAIEAIVRVALGAT